MKEKSNAKRATLFIGMTIALLLGPHFINSSMANAQEQEGPQYVGVSVGNRYVYDVEMQIGTDSLDFVLNMSVVEIDEVWTNITVINCSVDVGRADPLRIQELSLGFLEDVGKSEYQPFLVFNEDKTLDAAFESNSLFFISQEVDQKEGSGGSNGVNLDLAYDSNGALQKLYIEATLQTASSNLDYKLSIQEKRYDDSAIPGYPSIAFATAAALAIGVIAVWLNKKINKN